MEALLLRAGEQAMTCIYEVPDADAIRRHAEAAKVSCCSVAEVVEHVAT